MSAFQSQCEVLFLLIILMIQILIPSYLDHGYTRNWGEDVPSAVLAHDLLPPPAWFRRERRTQRQGRGKFALFQHTLQHDLHKFLMYSSMSSADLLLRVRGRFAVFEPDFARVVAAGLLAETPDVSVTRFA